MAGLFKVGVGDTLPQCEILNSKGEPADFSSYLGTWLIIYFYPKDNTPGCTKEAKAFKDIYPLLQAEGAEVIGISVDSVKSHLGFAKKLDLPFPLFSDEKRELVETLGIYGEKKFMGKTYLGTFRTSLLMNPEGKIAKLYEKIKPETHPEEVLRDVIQFKKK